MIFDKKRVLITGGTGSLGRMVLKAILSEQYGRASLVRIFSRDETKQYEMRKALQSLTPVEFHLGDIRCYPSVLASLTSIDIVINAAALKHVPACELDPMEAVMTNIIGPRNIVRAIKTQISGVQKVLGISTDKACAPCSVMGMTKAIQERIFIQANKDCETNFSLIRYGNMLESRGSVVPLFRDQIARGGPVTVTHKNMVRFLLPLEHAARHLIQALENNFPGQIYVPRMRSAYIDTLAKVMIGNNPRIDRVYTGIRPGEKLEDVIISEDESPYVTVGNEYFFINPPIRGYPPPDLIIKQWKYSSADRISLMNEQELKEILDIHE